MPVLDRMVDNLCAASRHAYRNPYAGLSWPDRLPEDAWCFSPELLSLHGTPAYEALPEDGQRRLAFFEAVSFFSLNVHGERALLEGVARRLYRPDQSHTAYLHHFLDEENKHMVYFGTFCMKYAGKVYPDWKIALPRDFAPGEEDVLFFAKVLVFEEIVDAYNRRMATDERLHPLVREINRLHHRDESRHLAFGRRLVKELWDRHAPSWSEAVTTGVREYLQTYVRSTWREYWNPSAYRDAGLPEAYELAQQAWDAPAARDRRQTLSRPCLDFLRRLGALEESACP